MQARWALSLWSGAAAQPSAEEFQAHVDRVQQRAEEKTPKFSQFVNYIQYMDMLAEDIGCRPAASPLTSPWLAWKLFGSALHSASPPCACSSGCTIKRSIHGSQGARGSSAVEASWTSFVAWGSTLYSGTHAHPCTSETAKWRNSEP
jgi:hypothetical protein